MTSAVWAVDPGYKESALVVWSGERVVEHALLPNAEVLWRLSRAPLTSTNMLVLEQMAFYSSSHVGAEVFESVFWSGRFLQVWLPRPWDRLVRSKVRGHLGAGKGGDAAVRQALISRFGPYKEQAVGTKAAPGVFYGLKADEWQALALAVTWWDLQSGGR